MLLQLLLLIVGLTALVLGGEWLVRGASGLARVLGVPPLVIGLSIVAFGTSAPELAVNVLATWSGNGGVSFGNIMGSNLANLGLVLAIAALIRPIEIKAPIILREIPMMLLATATVVILAADGPIRGLANSYDRSDGVVLLLLFCVFLYYTIGDVLGRRGKDEFLEDAAAFARKERKRSLVAITSLMLIGLATLIGGGKLAVEAAVTLARGLGVSEAIIGLTIIAVGTSLPELTTSIIAARRREIDLAVGNIVGSNIFNLLFVLGVTATVAPVPIPERGYADLAAVAFLSVLVLVMSVNHQRKIVRIEAVLLLALYICYLCWRSFPAVV